MRLCYICTENPELGQRLSRAVEEAQADWSCTVFPDAETVCENLTRRKPDLILVDAENGSQTLMRDINLLADSSWTILVGGDTSTDLPQLPAEFQPSDLQFFLENPPETFDSQQEFSVDGGNMVTRILLDHIWSGLLNHWMLSDRAMIQTAAKGVGLAGLENMHVLPILVKTVHQKKADTTLEQSTLDHFFFESIFSECILGGTPQGTALDRFEQKWVVLLYIEDTPIPAGALQERCLTAASRAEEEGWQLSFVVGAPVLPEDLTAQVARLEALGRSDVGYRTAVRTLQDAVQEEEELELPDMMPWRRLLETGEFRAVADAVSTCVLSMASERELTTQWLLQFRNAFVEEIYKAIHIHGIPIGEAFPKEDTEDSAFTRASVSIQQLLAWVDTVMSDMEQAKRSAAPDSVVQQAQKYIMQHLDQNLSREEIAKNVYVSCGYLGRLFKKELHMNMSEYIFSERMKVAQQMLEQTDLYITTIAMNVGYSNFPYFSTQFKQYSGCSPMEYRKRSRSVR